MTDKPLTAEERPFQTAEDIRAAINDACPLHNPRLSEVDWAAVGRAFDARRTLDADRERPSALDVGALKLAWHEEFGNTFDHSLQRILARLTEPDAGEGTEATLRDELIYRVEALRDITERTARMGSCSQTHHEHLASDARAALQQPAVQPECECGCGYPNSGPYVRRASAQPEGGPE